MMRRFLRTCLVVVFLGSTACVFAQQAYVLLPTGSKKECSGVTADSSGNLTLTIGAAKINLRRGAYRYVVTPKPGEVANLEQAADGGQNKAIVTNAGPIYETFKYLGWGGYIAAIQANALLATGNATGALNVLKSASAPEIVGAYADEYNKAMVAALIALDRGEEAVLALQKLKASKNNDLAAFAFLADGQILEKEGKKKEAVIAYLKTILLFKDGTVDAEKRQARQRVAALLESMGDPRAAQFK